jgi:hypothetical protein
MHRIGSPLSAATSAVSGKTHIALRQVRVLFVDIRRIADNHVKPLPCSALNQSLCSTNVVDGQMLFVASCQRHGIGHAVNRRHRAIRTLVASASAMAPAGSQIENTAREAGNAPAPAQPDTRYPGVE